MYREKLETFESILKKVNVRLRIILSVLKAPLLLHWECVLSFLQSPMQNPTLGHSAPRAGRYPCKLRAFRILEQDICFRTTVNSVATEVQILLEHLENLLLLLF